MNEINLNNISHEELIEYVKALQNKNAELKEKSNKLESTVEKQSVMIMNLNEMLVKGRKMLFGKSSEQIKYLDGAEQISFFNEAEKEYNAAAPEPTEETLVAAHVRKPKCTKEGLTENLPHHEVVCELEDKSCTVCGAEFVVIGKEKLRSELNIVPAQIFVIDYYRNVYKCAECEKKTDETKVIKAEAPAPVMKKSMASAATVAYVMQEKYQVGVPLFRQEQYWHSQGIKLNRNTLANWIIRSSLWFKPVWDYMKAIMLSQHIIHADETELRVLKNDGKPTGKMARMWVFCSGQACEKQMAVYYYHPTRAGKVVTDILGDYGGFLQTDGYAAYNAAEKSQHVGCWSHARRKFVDCLPKGVKRDNSKSAEALELIGQMFSIENEIENDSPDERIKMRQEKTIPLLNAYWSCLEDIHPVGGSALEKAVNYSLNRKAVLSIFTHDERIEMTNNRAERAVKPFVMARKNFLFSDTEKGAQASAMCFSMIETAKMNKLNVYGYLMFLLTELPKFGDQPSIKQLDSVMPWAKIPNYCMVK